MPFVWDVAKKDADEAQRFTLGDHDAHIASATAKQKEDTGNCMINFRWQIDAGPDVDKIVGGRLGFWVSDINVRQIEEFCAAIGRNPSDEFGGKEIDNMAFLTEWAETLIGESATVRIGMSKPSAGYASRPEVQAYKPYGSAANLAHLDDLL